MEVPNKHMVGVQADQILVMLPPTRLTKTEALVYAAWIVALADDDAGEEGSQFSKVLDAVLAT